MQTDSCENESFSNEYLSELNLPDAIMEPDVFQTLSKCIKAGASPELVVSSLADSYVGYAHMVNILCEWINCFSSESNNTFSEDICEENNQKDKPLLQPCVQVVEELFQTLLLKVFDPVKADTLLLSEQQAPPWIETMISHRRWRTCIYELSEKFKNCVLLNFVIQRISDAGYQSEMGNLTSVLEYFEIFNGVLTETLANLFQQTNNVSFMKLLPEFLQLSVASQPSFIYTQLLLKNLVSNNVCPTTSLRLCEEMENEISLSRKSRNALTIGSSIRSEGKHLKVIEAIQSMVDASSMNPLDAHRIYSAYEPLVEFENRPPAYLIQNTQLIHLLLHALFQTPSSVKPNHRSNYFYLLAYACSVSDHSSDTSSYLSDALKVQETMKSLEMAYEIFYQKGEIIQSQRSEMAVNLIVELVELSKIPIVAAAMIHWISQVFRNSTYFSSNFKTTSTPIHFLFLDQIVQHHPLLHGNLFKLLQELFERDHGLEALVAVELKKCILQRMLSLCIYGYVLEIVEYISACMASNRIDMSLFRFFVTGLLDMIKPPFSSIFVSTFLQLLESKDALNAFLLSEGKSLMMEFILHCESQNSSSLPEEYKLTFPDLNHLKRIASRLDSS